MVKTAADVEPVGSILYIDKKGRSGPRIVSFDAETRVDPKIGGKLKFKIMLIIPNREPDLPGCYHVNGSLTQPAEIGDFEVQRNASLSVSSVPVPFLATNKVDQLVAIVTCIAPYSVYLDTSTDIVK